MAVADPIDSLAKEADALARLLLGLNADTWSQETQFKQWTVFDVVAHLHYSDFLGLASLTESHTFDEELRDFASSGLSPRDHTRRWIGEIAPASLVAKWRETLSEVCRCLQALPANANVRWLGPPMNPSTFAVARLMETWAHAWEVYDLTNLPRMCNDDIYHIAELGVRTYGWSFRNRKLLPPDIKPFVQLVAPSGGLWTWNSPGSEAYIRGDAVAFCQVVTQVRHHADTSLDIHGEAAVEWMDIAQCFAGPPHDPPVPGTRGPNRAC